jgi:hypothetical protein
MQLSSVRGLKEEITAGATWIAARDDKRKIALGVAPGIGRSDYRLAIRARSESDLEPELLNQMTLRAKGEIDLHITGPIEVRPASGGAAAKSLSIGASAGHFRCTAGTVGFFAQRASDGAIGIVSNNHVLAAEDQGADRDDILHPARADRGRRPNDVVAHLSGDYPRLHRVRQTVDCAFARLVQTVRFDPVSVGAGERLVPVPATPEEHLEVTKIGRTTGRTRGRITAFDLDAVDVDYACGTILFDGQIEIESLDATPFCCPGDSGSLVFTTGLQPLGLLFCGSSAGGTFKSGRGYANPIGSVLEALGVTIVS